MLFSLTPANAVHHIQIDVMETLVESYTEVLLIGYACNDYGIVGYPEVTDRTIQDFIGFGMSKEDAADTVYRLIETEGPRVASIINEEAKISPDGTKLYCTTAYNTALSKLDQARMAMSQLLNSSDETNEET